MKLGEKPAPLPLRSPGISHEIARDSTGVSVVRIQSLTARDKSRSSISILVNIILILRGSSGRSWVVLYGSFTLTKYIRPNFVTNYMEPSPS
jgi:hypothetical protein